MADISKKHVHGLTLEEAKAKTEQIVADVKSEFPALVDAIEWNADKTRAKVKGKAFEGDFSVDQSAVSIDINLKFLAKPFKGKVEEKIDSRLTRYFS